MANAPPNIHLMPNRQLRPPSPASSHLSDQSSRSALTIRSNSSQPSVEGAARSDAASSSSPSELNIRVKVNRKLTWLDVCAFIVNKMIGTGIFTGPPVILSYTGKKSTAIWLWTAGFVYTLLSTVVYLEYARKLPYTGGQLVYLDALWPCRELLAYTCYSIYFVCLYTTATSSMQFASQVIMAATKSDGIPDQRVMRLIAVALMSLVCLLLYFSTSTGRKLNRYSALLKVILLIVVIIAGGIAAGKSPAHDITHKAEVVKSRSAVALLQVLYAYQGWENATLIAGEIPNFKVLRRGFITGVSIVGILYVLINIVYCYAIPWNQDGTLELEYVPLFFKNSERAKVAWEVLTALSAVGSNLSVTYTAVRVKQTIAWTNILPWSTFWRKYAPLRTEEPRDTMELQRLMAPAFHFEENAAIPEVETGTPQGGIVLHGLACIIQICLSSAIKKVTEAVSFFGLISSYASAMFGIAIGIRYPALSNFEPEITDQRGWNPGPNFLGLRYSFKCFEHAVAAWIIGFLYAGASFVIMIVTALGPYKNSDGSERSVKGWWFPVTTFGLLIFSILYYYVFIASENHNGAALAGVRMHRREHGVDDKNNIMRQCDQCVFLPDTAHRHYRDGYRYYNDFQFPEENQSKGNLLYWVFGGPNEIHYPSFRLREHLWSGVDMIGATFNWAGSMIQGVVLGRRQ